ncbi:hypothetical protein RF11_00841 [Thelohanellus kitauei]|uniref:SCP domain-containing protein n=1 Tax=Thelohanellus kitauei TaxID=669202 RepID=A0A0C2IRJ1_THEKT|nr:hypothetical protein RF11_00841 [Thelohanellus kitauei]
MGKNLWIFVVIYNPKGNIREEYSTNVLAPIPKHSEYEEEAEFGGSEFINAVLDHHNELRSKHDALPLEWAKVLATEARTWVEYLISKQTVMKNPNSKRGQIVDFEWGKIIL